MLFVNSGQFKKHNFEFVNFPDSCGDTTTVVFHLYVSISNSPPTVNIYLKNYTQGNTFLPSFVSEN